MTEAGKDAFGQVRQPGRVGPEDAQDAERDRAAATGFRPRRCHTGGRPNQRRSMAVDHGGTGCAGAGKRGMLHSAAPFDSRRRIRGADPRRRRSGRSTRGHRRETDHGTRTARDRTSRGSRPPLELAPRAAGAGAHGRRLRDAGRLPPPARYRLARAREALRNSECGALLLFDVNNIRYVSGTKIGEWERDKFCRFALSPTAASRSSGTSARPRCTTGSIATGSTRPTAAPACSACAARSRRASA